MKQFDEMDRSVRLRSESIGFKVVLLGLAFWILYGMWNYWFNAGEQSVFPALLTTVGVCTQQLSMRAIKQKMVAGDDEYKESNVVLRIIIMSIVVVAIVLSIGAYLMSIGK
jgi:hypothetical protein